MEKDFDYTTNENGAPKSAYDSVALIGNEFPVEQGFEWMMECSDTQNCKYITSKLLENYPLIDSYFDYWSMVEQLASEDGDKEMQDNARNIIERIQRMFTNYSIVLEDLPISPEARNKNINIYEEILYKIAKGKHPEVYTSILRGALNTAEGEKQATKLVYDILNTAVETYEDDIIKYALQLTSYNDYYFYRQDKLRQDILKAQFSSDDETLKKALEIELLKSSLAPIYIPAKHRSKEVKMNIGFLEDYLKNLLLDEDISLKEKIRLKKIMEFMYKYLNSNEDGYTKFDPDNLEEYPGNLILTNQGSLMISSQWLTVSKIKNDSHIPIVLPGVGAYSPKIEDADIDNLPLGMAELISNNNPTTLRELIKAEKASVINYLRKPINNVEQIHKLKDLNKTLKTKLLTDFKRPLSPRGNEIRITDKDLQSFGYSHLQFKRGQDINGLLDTDIRIYVFLGNFRMTFLLDENYSLLDPKTHKTFGESIPNLESLGELVIETWILGHLEELLCKEVDEFTRENLPDSKTRNTFEKGYIARVGHLRRVRRMSFIPNDMQIKLAKEENGWDLIEINNVRRKQRKCPVTYVRKTEVKDDQNRRPIKFYAHSATHKFNQIF